ncbi:hypothetical protein DFH11DRAFT_1547910 [Phellopilus nigrolimitatus]|nr:hypothetical protein DFH11DRAFT_1547910 [Phellopilus nigrolimitatus]
MQEYGGRRAENAPEITCDTVWRVPGGNAPEAKLAVLEKSYGRGGLAVRARDALRQVHARRVEADAAGVTEQARFLDARRKRGGRASAGGHNAVVSPVFKLAGTSRALSLHRPGKEVTVPTDNDVGTRAAKAGKSSTGGVRKALFRIQIACAPSFKGTKEPLRLSTAAVRLSFTLCLLFAQPCASPPGVETFKCYHSV